MAKLVGSFALIMGAVGLAYLASGQGSAGSACPASGCGEKTAAVQASYDGGCPGKSCCPGEKGLQARTVSSSGGKAGAACCESQGACCAEGQACCAEGKACCADDSCCEGAACPVSDTVCPKEGCGKTGEKQAETPENDDARSALVFDDASFEKGFAKRAKPAEKKQEGSN